MYTIVTEYKIFTDMISNCIYLLLDFCIVSKKIIYEYIKKLLKYSLSLPNTFLCESSYLFFLFNL